MTAIDRLRATAKRFVKKALPLGLRKRLSVLIGRQRWLGGRYWYSLELLRDFAEERPSEFHRFLWENHIGYAETYEIAQRFGGDGIHPSRRMLFRDLLEFLRGRGIDPSTEVRSVFEVGCSMGYLLRHMEDDVFPGAKVLEGVDIDAYAVRRGSTHLERIGSRVRIRRADMEELGRLLDGRCFDLILAAGVLMYLPEESAAGVVRTLLDHASGFVVLTGPAHPTVDNRLLEASLPRERDHAFIHNLDEMVESAGGNVAWRRWEGGEVVDGNTIYWTFAEPGGQARDRGP